MKIISRLLLLLLLGPWSFFAQRDLTLIDSDWSFSFGHPYDTNQDFGHATGYFSYLAKTGYGDGAASPTFDDRPWRKLDLPHDWAVEQPFSEKGSFSHGFKASGKNFPDRSIGWYRKKITIAESDLGRIITLKFDGVFRNSKVWFNGHYLGTEESGYNEFEYDITAYINYGTENTIAVRADAAMEEGWFYEGAGIYRHVHLQKTNPLHVANDGTFITTTIGSDSADIKIRVSVENKSHVNNAIEIIQTVYDASGKTVASSVQNEKAPGFYETASYDSNLKVNRPALWDIDHPNLYRLETQISQKGKIVDSYSTTFGIRSIRFDADQGFFLNGKPLKLKGTNNHQDHAGVGAALPDALQYFRIEKLKEMGANAYRCSHHPPTRELLEACDKLGMLVIDETRLMGINDIHLESVKRMIARDRNHPSVFCWSMGNEEWAIESNITGERIATTMQDFAKSIDSTRPVTVGLSSGFKSGISSVVEIIGYNYMANGDIDAHHDAFKLQPGMGTEEGSTFATRGIYVTDDALHYKSAYDQKPRPNFYSIEEGWTFYATRPYLAGMFVWTGFDYRGEPTPYGWPSVTSYFGMMDVCGFEKDNAYYLKSWWGNTPVVHILPHWNWPGKEGQQLDVRVYSNCEEVELLFNKKSLGRKKMPQFGHLQWNVLYATGTLEAVGYTNGRKVVRDVQRTTSEPARIKLTAYEPLRDGVAIVTVETVDKNGLHVPTADSEITFGIQGGEILGVGNGNPTSLENEKFIDGISLVSITDLEEQSLGSAALPQQLPAFGNQWKTAFENRDYKNLATSYGYRGRFEIADPKNKTITFFYQKIGKDAVIFFNGQLVKPSNDDAQKYVLAPNLIKKGINEIHIIATPLQKVNEWDVMNTNPGVIRITTPSSPWKRKLFNGYAQIIVKANRTKTMTLSASAAGLSPQNLKIEGK